MNEGHKGSIGRVRSVLFAVGVMAAFSLGFYSLFLASVKAGKLNPLAGEGLVRTATAGNKDQIERALGAGVETELAYVLVPEPTGLPDPEPERAVRIAARSLADSGLAVSVRSLAPGDPDYATVVKQNGIRFFPSVLMVKRNGGIVRVNGGADVEKLVNAYQTVWGKKSDCGAARNAVY